MFPIPLLSVRLVCRRLPLLRPLYPRSTQQRHLVLLLHLRSLHLFLLRLCLRWFRRSQFLRLLFQLFLTYLRFSHHCRPLLCQLQFRLLSQRFLLSRQFHLQALLLQAQRPRLGLLPFQVYYQLKLLHSQTLQAQSPHQVRRRQLPVPQLLTLQIARFRPYLQLMSQSLLRW